MKCTKCSNAAELGFKMCSKCREKNKLKCKNYANSNRKKIRESHKKWRDQNKDRIQAYGVKYTTKNKDKELARSRKYQEENREKVRESGRKCYQNNREKVLAQCKIYREANKERYEAYHRNWYLANRDRYLENCARYRRANPDAVHRQKLTRRAREYTTVVVPINRTYIFERDEWICKICGAPVIKTVPHKHPLYPTLDHIIPLSKGGAHTPDNLQCAHLWCNSKKGAKLNFEVHNV